MSETLKRDPSHAVIALASGHTLLAEGVVLYPSDILAEVLSLRETAATKLGGISTGVGFIGSPGWAIGAGTALGLLEGALSSSSKKEGVRILAQAEERRVAALQQGALFGIFEIENISQPAPGAWAATQPSEKPVDVSRMWRADRNQVLKTHGLTKTILSTAKLWLPIQRHYSHSGDDFVIVSAASALVSIRWSSVSAYLPPLRKKTPCVSVV